MTGFVKQSVDRYSVVSTHTVTSLEEILNDVMAGKKIYCLHLQSATGSQTVGEPELSLKGENVSARPFKQRTSLINQIKVWADNTRFPISFS